MSNFPRSLADLPVVILCGGLGTRLRSVVEDRPKALAPIGDTPFLTLQLELLRDQGARRFVLCVGHMADLIAAEYGDGRSLGIQIEYSREGGQLRGTAGALKLAERFFAPAAVVVNGDTYLDVDHNRLVEHHAHARGKHGAIATLSLARLADPSRYGSVAIDGNGECVVGFHEKTAGLAAPPDSPASPGWLNAGAYVLEAALIERIPAHSTCSLERDVFPSAIHAGCRLAAWKCDRPFFDIGTPADWRAFIHHCESIRHVARAS